jgi:two-component system, response regulator
MENLPYEILLVEDNPSDAELTIRALKKNNLVNLLVHLQDGAEALDFILGKGKYADRNTSFKPKMILLDLKMPKIDGMEVLRQLKTNEETRGIPIIILTSSKQNPDIDECYKLGANSYIVKPVDFEGFSTAVRELGCYWLLLNQPPY